MIAKLEWTQSSAKHNIVQLQNPTMGETTTNPQQQNHRLRKNSSLSHWGLNTYNWYQIFALDSAVVEAQKLFSSHGGFLTNAMYHHREIKSNQYTMMIQRKWLMTHR